MTSDWTVLLIGGAGAVGKTTAAKRISIVSGATLLQADDVWMALQGVVERDQLPGLRSFSDREIWRRPTREVVEAMRQTAEIVSRGLENVVGHHLAVADKIVVEGVWITPEFAARRSYAGSIAGERRRAVFVLEDDADEVRASMTARGRSVGHWTDEEWSAMAKLQASYSRWLRGEAKERSLPTVSARPVGHLAERILAVL